MKERELPVIIAACLLSAVLATTQAHEAKPDDIIRTVEKARAAGLDAPAIPVVTFSLDEIRELGSMEAMLERVVEHAKAHVGDDALLAAPLITPDLERMMQAIESDDADLLNEVLSDIAGVPVRLPTEEEQRLHDEGAIYVPRVRATTDEVLASMKPERAEALDDYRHLLDDEFELIASLDKIKDGLARSAAREFLTKLTPDPDPLEFEEMFPPEMEDQIRHARERARERGWYEQTTPPRGQSLLREAERLGSGVQSSLSAYAEIPATAESYSFDMLPGNIMRIDVVSDTKFGGVLYAVTSEIADIHFDDPNLLIMGHDGAVTTYKYSDGTWATAVTAFDGWHKYEVVLEQKLEDEQRDEFVRMATAMIEGDLSKFK